jgi:hypothetical protein
VGIAFAGTRSGPKWIRELERSFASLARCRHLSVLLVGALPLAVRLATLPVQGVPAPAVHDEFGYLLTAETFASGQIALAPHPMWAHFETMNIIHQPVYASVYPVAQSLFLAAADVAAGQPWLGVWASVGLMSAAICWMLQGWLPPGWALLGGLLAALRLGVFSYWMNSYWGGAVAALGGALVLGAVPRLVKSPGLRLGLLLGAGLALLANSRPYEGLLLSIPVAAELFYWARKKEAPGPGLRRALGMAAVVLSVAAGMMAYYNWRVTGKPYQMAYQVSQKTYGFPTVFLWESSRQPAANSNAQMLEYWNWMHRLHTRDRTLSGFARLMLGKVRTIWYLYFWPLFTVPLLMLPWILRDRRMWFLLFVGAVSCVGLAAQGWTFPHYAAPATAVVFALIVQGMRHLRVWKWRGRPAGLFLVRAVPALCVVMLGVRAFAGPLGLSLGNWPVSWCSENRPRVNRPAIENLLQHRAGSSLVLVRYAPGHDIHEEWVYNRADIDASPVVWARDLGPVRNNKLIRYYKDRSVWLFEPDRSPPRIAPYRPGEAAAVTAAMDFVRP